MLWLEACNPCSDHVSLMAKTPGTQICLRQFIIKSDAIFSGRYFKKPRRFAVITMASTVPIFLLISFYLIKALNTISMFT